MNQPRLADRIHESLTLLSRPGGALLKAERELISSTIRDLAFVANEEVERKALAEVVATLRGDA